MVRVAAKTAASGIYKFRMLIDRDGLPLKTYEVSISEVQFISARIENHSYFSKYFYHGVVMKGDWDLDRVSIESSELFKFSKSVFLDRDSPEETTYYKKVLSGELEPYLLNERHLRIRLDSYITLFQRIKSDGYRAQTLLRGGAILDEICISIDREGKAILEDGRHRFMIAKCLGLKKIPVIINRVHEIYWQKSDGNPEIAFETEKLKTAPMADNSESSS